MPLSIVGERAHCSFAVATAKIWLFMAQWILNILLPATSELKIPKLLHRQVRILSLIFDS